MSQLRHIDARIESIVIDLRTAASWLEEHARDVLSVRQLEQTAKPGVELDRSGRCPHEVPGAVGCERCSPNPNLTPVERAAMQGATSEELHRRQMLLRSAIDTMWDNAGAVVNEIAWIRERMPKDPRETRKRRAEVEESQRYCVELYCEDLADPKCAGRCRADYEYRRRHPELSGPIPRSYYEDRSRRRSNAKVRVSGPMAGEVA